ncbi:MAG: flagellar assembly protein FliH [Gammaproteobacteria bacterium]
MNSSEKSAKFSADELKSLSRWNLPDVSGEAEAAGTEKLHAVKESPLFLTVGEIESIQKRAYTEAYEQGRREGYEKGYEEGREEGFRQGFEDGSRRGYDENLHLLRKQAAEMVGLMESFSEPFADLDERVVRELASLSMGVAAQLVRRELRTDPGQIVAVVREAVSILPASSQRVSLHLHPDDAELVRKSMSPDHQTLPWRVIEDPLLTRGGCRLDADSSHIDASIERRLAAIFTNVMGGEREEDDR